MYKMKELIFANIILAICVTIFSGCAIMDAYETIDSDKKRTVIAQEKLRGQEGFSKYLQDQVTALENKNKQTRSVNKEKESEVGQLLESIRERKDDNREKDAQIAKARDKINKINQDIVEIDDSKRKIELGKVKDEWEERLHKLEKDKAKLNDIIESEL